MFLVHGIGKNTHQKLKKLAKYPGDQVYIAPVPVKIFSMFYISVSADYSSTPGRSLNYGHSYERGKNCTTTLSILQSSLSCSLPCCAVCASSSPFVFWMTLLQLEAGGFYCEWWWLEWITVIHCHSQKSKLTQKQTGYYIGLRKINIVAVCYCCLFHNCTGPPTVHKLIMT